MIIPEYAMKNFQIDYATDSEEAIMMKRFFLNNDKVSRQVLAMLADEREHQRDFDKNYQKIMKMNNLKDLKAQIVEIDKLLNGK
jgi:rubrerythrin